MFLLSGSITHRSFPRILPDSSYSPGASLNSFKVWRKNDLSSVKCILKICQFFSSLAQPFHYSFRSASTIHGGVSRCHLKTEEEFLFNLAPFSSRFVILACCHPLVIVLIVRIIFTLPERFKSLLSLLSRVHHFGIIHSQLSVIILQFYRWRHSQVALYLS